MPLPGGQGRLAGRARQGKGREGQARAVNAKEKQGNQGCAGIISYSTLLFALFISLSFKRYFLFPIRLQVSLCSLHFIRVLVFRQLFINPSQVSLKFLYSSSPLLFPLPVILTLHHSFNFSLF
jgi:hypothetical protein